MSQSTKFSSIAGRLPVSTANPTSPQIGEEYYNTNTNQWMRWNGVDFLGAAFTTSTSTSTTSTSTTTSTTTS